MKKTEIQEFVGAAKLGDWLVYHTGRSIGAEDILTRAEAWKCAQEGLVALFQRRSSALGHFDYCMVRISPEAAKRLKPNASE